MAVMSKQDPSPAFTETVQEIMRLYRSLPPRPSIEAVAAAKCVLRTVESEEKLKLEEISMEQPPEDVPDELFSILKQVKKTMVLFQSHEQKKDALYLVEADKLFETFDELIQRASSLVSGDTQDEKVTTFKEPVRKFETESVITDDSLVKRKVDGELDKHQVKGGLVRSSSTKASFFSGEDSKEKLNLMKAAALIEDTAKKGAMVLDLRGKLMDQIEWLPVSIGKLKDVSELDLSENRIMSLPPSIGGLRSLTKLDLHSNQLINLPDSVGELVNLIELDLHANRLKGLPTTMGNLSNLKELDVSFNEIEAIPENLCFAVSLRKMNVGKNFADLRALPRSIGNLEMLEELDISDNQIRALPESFGMLSKLRVFVADETPLEVPPREVVKLGAQAVVQYMANLVSNRDTESQAARKKKGFWARFCSIFWSSRNSNTNAM
ncbi:hypothetical protein COLO4_17066 [Corchorus olitorius]|uniref:Disease resistance R13L4/SHOC-2-like LRR domain-containing protein n=1 Tax=Corchorus olitorius TaxID=93759 RepID=A0A1R3JEB8_9ROSI|nr:hypothetical protein COLO4_17066 [Corchorus olitorius]